MPRLPLISVVIALYLGGLLIGFTAPVQVTHVAIGAALVSAVTFRHRRAGVVSLFLAIGVLAARTAGRSEGARASPQAVAPGTGAVLPDSSPPLLARMRLRTGATIDRVFRRDAPLARALLIADKQELSPELRDRFAAAGMSHVLSVAGLHIATLALIVELALGLVGFPARYKRLVSLTVVVVYVGMLGAPPSAVRAAAMLAARAISRAAQRPTSPWTILTLGALQPLVTPRTVLEAGYQLSIVGVAALIAGGVVIRRMKIRARPRWRRALITGVVCSTLATVATAPLVLWLFGRVSLVGPLTSLVAGPIVVLLQPMLVLALVASPLPGAAAFVAGAAHPLLAALDGIAGVAASIPGASVSMFPTPVVAALGAVASGAVVVACMHERPARPAAIGLLACGLIAWLPSLPARNDGFAELHVIDVGQGDAIALRSPNGHWVVFDAGRAWRGGDAGRSTVVPYIARRGGPMDVFVLSHPHTDHVGGAAAVIHALKPERYFDAAFAAPNESYIGSLQAAREEHVAWARVHPGDSLGTDGMEITFLAPDSAWTVSLPDPNNASTVALVRIGDVRILLVGDAEAPEEDWLLARDPAALHADILKVGHHGSATSSTARFLDAVRPRLALISVGAGNMYGHPSPSVIEDLVDHHAQVLRTDRLGSIVVRTDGHRIIVIAGGRQWELPGQ